MKKLIWTLCMAAISFSSFSQPVEFSLWDGAIPNNKPGNHTEKQRVEADGTVSHVSEVQEPSLTVYAPQGVANKRVPAIIICPGGGYTNLSIKKEGHDVAKFLASQGVVGIVLKYRLPSDVLQTNKHEVPLSDALQAIRTVRTRAAEWNIDTTRIGIMGFSAGGHLASTASVQWGKQPDAQAVKIDFSVLIYPVVSMAEGVTHKGSQTNLLGDAPTSELVDRFSNALQISESTPRTFIVHSFDDGAVPIRNTFEYIEGLNRVKIECEAHLYRKGGHGYGMLPGTTDSWPALLITWLKSLN
jgi:acetyl esterase/lipase